MRRFKFSAFPVVVLSALFCIAGCQNDAVIDDREQADALNYSISVQQTANGNISVYPVSSPANFPVKVYVNPNLGYILDPASLKFIYGGNNEYTSAIFYDRDNGYSFDMYPSNGYVTAQFIQAPANNYTVNIGKISNGKVEVFPQYGPPGTEVKVYVKGNEGYGVKSLKQNGAEILFDNTAGYAFTMGAANVTITGEFEQKDAAEFLSLARDMLTLGDYDSAFSYYEWAYQKDKTNTEAVVYSALGKLAGILKDPAVRPVLQQINLAVVGNNLNQWFCDAEWMQGRDDNARWYGYFVPDMDDGSAAADGTVRYDPNNDRQYYGSGAWLPRLGYPRNFPTGGFLNYSITHESVNNANERYRWYWDAQLLYNLIGNNEDGLNKLLDDILAYVFGAAFEDAAARCANLNYTDTVTLHPRLKSRFHLEGFYGPGEMRIGKAELDLIFSLLRSIKAGFEFLASYDWEMDTRMLRVASVAYDYGLNDILDMIIANIDDEITSTNSRAFLSRFLPLRSRFLKDRNNGMMPRAKNDLIKAVNAAIPAFNYYSGGTSHISAEGKSKLNGDLAWVSDMLTKLQTALSSGGNFYFSTELPKGQASWYDAASGKYGVDVSQLLTAGNLSIDKLLVTEGNGQYPVFHKLSWNWGAAPYPDSQVYGGVKTKITTLSDFGSDNDDIFSIELNTANIKRVLVKGFSEDAGSELFCIAVPEIYVWKSYIPGGAASGSNGIYKATYIKYANARKLFEYYR